MSAIPSSIRVMITRRRRGLSTTRSDSLAVRMTVATRVTSSEIVTTSSRVAIAIMPAQFPEDRR